MAELLIEKTCQHLQICSELGCYNFIFHGLVKRGLVEPSDNDALIGSTFKTLDSINDYAIKLGVNCFLENGCFTKSLSSPFCEAPSEPFLHLILAQTFAMGVVLDLGHAALSARWYGQKELMIFFYRICRLHIRLILYIYLIIFLRMTITLQ